MKIYDIELSNKVILGSSGYPSPKVFINCVKILKVEMVTVAIRRLNNNDNNFLDITVILLILCVTDINRT